MFLVLSNNIKIFCFLFTVFKITTANFLLTILKLLGSKIIFNRGKQQMFSFTSHSDHILTNPMYTLNYYAVCLPFLCLILMSTGKENVYLQGRVTYITFPFTFSVFRCFRENETILKNLNVVSLCLFSTRLC